jgi:hypothetical protein
MAPTPTRRGTLIIIVAGMSALLASLAVAFAFKVRGDSNGADQVVRIAQARILLNAVMVYTISRIDAVGIATGLPNLQANLVGLGYPVRLRPADINVAATFNTAWMNIERGTKTDLPRTNSYAIDVLVGSGPSRGETGPDSRSWRLYEPRYRFKITISPPPPSSPLPPSSQPPASPPPPPRARITKIESMDIDL